MLYYCFTLCHDVFFLELFQVVFLVARVVLTGFLSNQVVTSCANDTGCCDRFVSVFIVAKCFRLLYVVVGSSNLLQFVSTCFSVCYVVSICSGSVGCSSPVVCYLMLV